MLKISFLSESPYFERLNTLEVQLTRGAQSQSNSEDVEHAEDIDDNTDPIWA